MELIQRRNVDRVLVPQVRGDETVSVANGNEGSLQGVLSSSGRTDGNSEAVLDTSELEDLGDGRRGDDSLTTGSGDKTDSDTTTLTSDLGSNSVGLTDQRTPVTTTNGDNVELSNTDSSTDGSGNFLGSLDTKTDVSVLITNDDDGTVTVTLTSRSLLLDRLDLHDLVLKVRKELVNDLDLLNRKRVGVDLLKAVDLAGLNKTTELGNGAPNLLFISVVTASTAGTTESTSRGSGGRTHIY